MTPALHVLVVDDSALVRQSFAMILSRESDMSVAVAADPLIALSKMALKRPDVIILDLEMPRMDGLSFLRKVMADDPVPVVVCSGSVGRGTEAAFQAIDEGAVEVIAKPRLGVREFLERQAHGIADTVRAAASSRRPLRREHPALGVREASTPLPSRAAAGTVVAIGASTGGPEALFRILTALPKDGPATLVVQHMPEGFTAAFAARLGRACLIEVKEAAEGDAIRPGRVLIAPGNRHLRVRGTGGFLRAEVGDDPPVSRHRPSVNALLSSVAASVGRDAVGVILTGMGDDGASGLLEMRRAGARTFAQDEATSVVFGMPKSAIACGAVSETLPLPRIAEAILGAEPRPLKGSRPQELLKKV